MSIKKHLTITRTCDLCGKQEGVHLKEKDFYKEAPCLIMKNYKGKDVKISLNVSLENYDKDNIESTLDDIIKSYKQTHQDLNYEALRDEDENMGGISDKNYYSLPTNIVNLLQDYYFKQFEKEQRKSVICKKCYKSMVSLITKFGKFDKDEVF
jgi:hypothetical protein